MENKKTYAGKIKNQGSQVVKALNQTKADGKNKKKTGKDLRAGKQPKQRKNSVKIRKE